MQTTSLTVLGILALALLAPMAARASGVTYTRHWINRTRVHVVWVNLSDPTLRVTPTLAWNTIGRRQSFISFIIHHQPLAQISGSFFSLKSGHPIGDLIIGNRRVYQGPVGSALAIRPDNRADIIDIPPGWHYSWPGYESVIQGGIRLVHDGKYAVNPRKQGFRDPALFRSATRTAVGLDARNRLLMVAVNKPISLTDLAGIMKALGCREAMALDGGTSAGLAIGSNIIITPGRTLANVLMVVKRTMPAPPVPVAESAAPPAAAAPPAPAPAKIPAQAVPTPPAAQQSDAAAMPSLRTLLPAMTRAAVLTLSL